MAADPIRLHGHIGVYFSTHRLSIVEMIQGIIVGIVIAVAAFFFVKQLLPKKKNTGCDKCGH